MSVSDERKKAAAEAAVAPHPGLVAAREATALAQARLATTRQSLRDNPEVGLRLRRERDASGAEYGDSISLRLVIPLASAPRTAAREAAAARAEAEISRREAAVEKAREEAAARDEEWAAKQAAVAEAQRLAERRALGAETATIGRMRRIALDRCTALAVGRRHDTASDTTIGAGGTDHATLSRRRAGSGRPWRGHRRQSPRFRPPVNAIAP